MDQIGAFQVARTPALPANQVNEAKVITAMPTVNLMARRLVSDRAPLQVAHLNSGQKVSSLFERGSLGQVLTIEWGVSLGGVHPEDVTAVLRAQVSRARGITNVLAGIVDDQSIRCGKQRNGGRFLVFSSIPDDTSGLLHGHVGAERIFHRVETARSYDVDRRWRDRQGGVVPHEGDILADLVVGCGRGSGGDHGHTTSSGSRVNGDRGGGGSLAFSRLRATCCAGRLGIGCSPSFGVGICVGVCAGVCAGGGSGRSLRGSGGIRGRFGGLSG